MPSYSSTICAMCACVTRFAVRGEGKKVGAPVRCLPRRPGCFGLVPFSAEYMLACKNSTETKCVPPLRRVDYEAFFRRSLLQGYSRRKKISTVAYEDFCLQGLISSFSGVLTMRLNSAVMLKQPSSSACFA